MSVLLYMTENKIRFSNVTKISIIFKIKPNEDKENGGLVAGKESKKDKKDGEDDNKEEDDERDEEAGDKEAERQRKKRTDFFFLSQT